MADMYFTLEQAQEMVGWLEETFRTLVSLREKARRLGDEIEGLKSRTSGNGSGNVASLIEQHQGALNDASQEMEVGIKQVHERGVIVKSIEEGLVDFPFLRDGREVYLCWRAGEADIRFWHDLEAGFAGRQPL
jgi:hypothetical protein